MKIFLPIVALLFTLNAQAQSDWVTETKSNYSIQHPDSWIIRESEKAEELMMSGATPDFEGSSEFVATTLFISSEKFEFDDMDDAARAYKKKLFGVEFLTNVRIKKEKKITLNGVSAVEIVFSADAQNVSSACRIILFQHNDLYYELSVTYDRSLSKKLMKEAYKVMDSFTFLN